MAVQPRFRLAAPLQRMAQAVTLPFQVAPVAQVARLSCVVVLGVRAALVMWRFQVAALTCVLARVLKAAPSSCRVALAKMVQAAV